ncbi:hypothetical protein DGG96_07300 [Legionella qingyii]|uniref:Uncharacterized protein n=1 Tax=Legionella qingyii TaxID=2184757 RepID=A0A317U6X8_9GAMM|nr:hypothetical protein DGG96_07300 [Legionella qingyii]
MQVSEVNFEIRDELSLELHKNYLELSGIMLIKLGRDVVVGDRDFVDSGFSSGITRAIISRVLWLTISGLQTRLGRTVFSIEVEVVS